MYYYKYHIFATHPQLSATAAALCNQVAQKIGDFQRIFQLSFCFSPHVYTYNLLHSSILALDTSESSLFIIFSLLFLCALQGEGFCQRCPTYPILCELVPFYASKLSNFVTLSILCHPCLSLPFLGIHSVALTDQWVSFLRNVQHKDPLKWS